MPVQFNTSDEDAKLRQLREKEEEDLVSILAPKYNAEYADLSAIAIEAEALRLVPHARAVAAEMAVVNRSGKIITVAFTNPNNAKLAEELDELTRGGYKIKRLLVSHRSLVKAHERYSEMSQATSSRIGVFGIDAAELEKTILAYPNLKALTERLDTLLKAKGTTMVSEAFEELFAASYALSASDIHIEPEEHAVRLRVRIDGLLEDAYTLETHVYHMLASRIKLLSGLKLNITNKAQDGRFTIDVGTTQIEIRTSVIPGAYGESFVLRILDPKTIHRSYEDMGMHPKLLERLRKEIRRPNGMLLCTGPTGSGKTTTLYTFLQDIYAPDIKIITIEDPIEYHLQGIVQTQTDGKDYTFASGLRSVLRQDPDVILVGEIRDKEVADTALQAALTGHFVLSTLHTNNAAGSFPRLVDLGADPKLFASAVSASMAQRLVRTLDDATKKQRPATPEEKAVIDKVLGTIVDTSLLPPVRDMVWDATPDIATKHSGYKGRIGIHEAIFMDDELGTFLRDNPAEGDIKKQVMRQGYLTMEQDGMLKVLAGKTTIEELRRVVDLPY